MCLLPTIPLFTMSLDYFSFIPTVLFLDWVRKVRECVFICPLVATHSHLWWKNFAPCIISSNLCLLDPLCSHLIPFNTLSGCWSEHFFDLLSGIRFLHVVICISAGIAQLGLKCELVLWAFVLVLLAGLVPPLEWLPSDPHFLHCLFI